MINIEINDINMQFETDPTLFSPSGLDRGTAAMLSCVEFKPDDKVLDLGCGYGVVGIYAAKLIGAANVTMSDISETATKLAKSNAELNKVADITVVCSNAFENITDSGYSLILSNPPYHTNFSVAKAFIEKGFNRLEVGGKMVMVTKRRDWYKNKFISIFGGVLISEVDGYQIFIAEKRSMHYSTQKRKKK